MADLCRQAGLTYQVLPSPHRECPTFQDGNNRATELYSRGVSAQRIHHEEDLPCQPDCPYIQKWDFDPNNYDVLIGHYQHAYLDRVTEGRAIIVDEFSEDAFINHFKNPGPIVSEFLTQHDLDYSDYTDLLKHRGDGSGETLFFGHQDVGFRSPELAIDNRDGHALAPVLTLGTIMADNLENGFESTLSYPDGPSHRGYRPPIQFSQPWRDVLGNRVLVRNRDLDEIWLLTPPDLSGAKSIVGLDGTPAPLMWEIVFGISFDRYSVLDQDEMNRYLDEIRGYTIKQTGDGLKPYSSGNYVTPDRDAALFLGVWANHDADPCLITPQAALDRYEREDLLDHTGDAMNFAQVRSSNRFAQERVGIVSGAPHPGDSVIKRWGALLGCSVEITGKGLQKTYGSIGDRIARYYIQHAVLQAILRFGRDGNGATVYVNTQAVPDWLETDSFVDVSRFTGQETRATADHLIEQAAEGAGATVQELRHETEVSNSHIRDVLRDLVDVEYVEKHDNAGFNGANLYEWTGKD